jgi:alpha-amylase
MGVFLQSFYRPGIYQPGDVTGVPSPVDRSGTEWWWDHLAKQAHAFRSAGFTAIWLPPPYKGTDGMSEGYGVFDDYDLGSKSQNGSVPTRYGTREQLVRCIAIMRANGLEVYVDLLENERNGGSSPGGFTFRYVDAYGNPGGGRFPKNPQNFHPFVPEDPDVIGRDYWFGPDLAQINGEPPGYLFNGLIDAADWMTRALDLQGYRIDDVKGVSSQFLLPLLNSKSMAGKFAVGEFFDSSLELIQDWIFNKMQGRVSAFDFPLRFQLAWMCNSSGSFDMSSLDHFGLAGVNPFNAVTFIEDHDTDSKPDQAVIRNKALAYAYILTSEGYPCVFYKDYSTDPGCYRMKGVIDPLIFVHEKIAAGPTVQRFKEQNLFAYERTGGAHLLTGLNNDEENSRTITVDTGFGPGVLLHDYTGHAPDVRTDNNGRATITVPRGQNGLGYVCYSVSGVGDDGFPISVQSVNQSFEGAQDLDIKPADDIEFVTAGRVWCEQGTRIRGSLEFDTKYWTDATRITLRLLGTEDQPLVPDKTYDRSTPQGDTISANTDAVGWHIFKIQSSNTPRRNLRPNYTLKVTYQAPMNKDLPCEDQR